MMRAFLVAALLTLVAGVAFAQLPPDNLEINVLYTSGDSVWVSVPTWRSNFPTCWCMGEVNGVGGNWYENRLTVVPCPAVGSAHVMEPCSPDSSATTFSFCDEDLQVVLGLDCGTTYTFFAYRVKYSGCFPSTGRELFDPDSTYCARVYTPSVPGCQAPATPVGACCLKFAWAGGCVTTTGLGCVHAPLAGGIFPGDGTTCQPAPPCIVPVRSTSWGRVKAIYR